MATDEQIAEQPRFVAYEHTVADWAMHRHVITVRVSTDITPEFVCAALNAADAREKTSSL